MSSELYIESIFRAIYGFVDEAPTSFEMGGLVVLHFLINGMPSAARICICRII
eukprot:SAG31_NODE_1243_length_9148_cov_8.476738_5_plen_53_part_00